MISYKSKIRRYIYTLLGEANSIYMSFQKWKRNTDCEKLIDKNVSISLKWIKKLQTKKRNNHKNFIKKHFRPICQMVQSDTFSLTCTEHCMKIFPKDAWYGYISNDKLHPCGRDDNFSTRQHHKYMHYETEHVSLFPISWGYFRF